MNDALSPYNEIDTLQTNKRIPACIAYSDYKLFTMEKNTHLIKVWKQYLSIIEMEYWDIKEPILKIEIEETDTAMSLVNKARKRIDIKDIELLDITSQLHARQEIIIGLEKQAILEEEKKKIKAQKISNFEKEFEELLDKHWMYCHGSYEIWLVDDDDDYYL